MDGMSEDGVEFLAGLYDPPLRRLPGRAGEPHERAKAAAWGEALKDWLAGCKKEDTRDDYRRAVAALWNFCRKLPWEVSQADVTGWVEEGLAEKTAHTKIAMLRRARLFYRFANEKTWTSPAGRRLRLCRENPAEGIQMPKEPWFPITEALSEAELERLLAAFDLETPFGRRDRALFTVILETGLHLREALKLRLRDVEPAAGGGPHTADSQMWPPQPSWGVAYGRSAAWEAVRTYLEADGRLAGMGPDDYIFTPLQDLAGKLAKKHPVDWGKQPLSLNGAWDALRDYAAWAGLDPERVMPKALRYSGARRLVEAGASTEEVAAFLRMKELDRVRHWVKRLKESESSASEQPPNPGSLPSDDLQPGWLDGFFENSSEDSPGSMIRRRRGAQPGNRYRLKHGLWAARYRVTRLGIYHNSIKDMDLDSMARAILDLRWMILEVFGLPEESLDILIKKSRKLGYLATVMARLKLAWAKKRGEEDGEDFEDLLKWYRQQP